MIEQIMRRNFVSGHPDESLESARQTMRMARLRHLLVVHDGKLMGILSYRDLLELLLAARGKGDARDAGSVGDAMTRSPAFVTPNTSLQDAADRVSRFGFGCLPVLESPAGGGDEPGRVAGIVTERDLLRRGYGLPSL